MAFLIVLLFLGFSAAATVPSATRVPVVDLGNSVHRASFNATGQYYNFSNIAYAEPPLGDLRFKRSIAPQGENRTVNDGSTERICPQATPTWMVTAVPPIALPTGNGSSSGQAAAAIRPQVQIGPDPRESEDCLLLDIMVPRAVFDAAQNRKSPVLKPVLVWIHGGGFVQGSKSANNPAGLLHKSMSDGRSGVVYVQINYRLGLFGFPPASADDTDVDPNTGLFDQQLALQWVQKNIPLFGGDPNEVTVMGQSAGAASILHQITAFGSPRSSGLFKRAILQSPATRPGSDAAFYQTVLQQFLATANVSSVSAARAFSSEQLQALNAKTVGVAPFSTFTYGPSVDGDFVPAPPTVLLNRRRFDNDLDVVVGHNANEGVLFTDAKVQDQTATQAFLSGLMPSISADTIETIVNRLYPENFTGHFGYTTQTERLTLIVSESVVTCNANSVLDAFENNGNGYLFSLFPGVHAQDIGYTFFNGPHADFFGPVEAGVADFMQAFIINFAQSRKTTTVTEAAAAGPQPLPNLPLFRPRFNVLNLTEGPFQVVQDPAANSRCEFWQTGLYPKQGKPRRRSAKEWRRNST